MDKLHLHFWILRILLALLLTSLITLVIVSFFPVYGVSSSLLVVPQSEQSTTEAHIAGNVAQIIKSDIESRSTAGIHHVAQQTQSDVLRVFSYERSSADAYKRHVAVLLRANERVLAVYDEQVAIQELAEPLKVIRWNAIYIAGALGLALGVLISWGVVALMKSFVLRYYFDHRGDLENASETFRVAQDFDTAAELYHDFEQHPDTYEHQVPDLTDDSLYIKSMDDHRKESQTLVKESLADLSIEQTSEETVRDSLDTELPSEISLPQMGDDLQVVVQEVGQEKQVSQEIDAAQDMDVSAKSVAHAPSNLPTADLEAFGFTTAVNPNETAVASTKIMSDDRDAETAIGHDTLEHHAIPEDSQIISSSTQSPATDASHEPTEQELKDRLNKLLQGNL